MKRTTVALLAVLLVSLSVPGYAQLVVPGADNTPKVGEKAPDFLLPKGMDPADTLGMKDFLGKKRVLVSFFPAAFTAG
jgi:hypothetical protein